MMLGSLIFRVCLLRPKRPDNVVHQFLIFEVLNCKTGQNVFAFDAGICVPKGDKPIPRYYIAVVAVAKSRS